ncbi:type IV-A pilus assembly ATPase PilB [Oceanospirillum sp.]|uniref:type IV-A pilus assembly ATPase PilB n=1 Tax=Oceanospirillum sp. TaxID=2021254 RepID=UPI003A9553A1
MTLDGIAKRLIMEGVLSEKKATAIAEQAKEQCTSFLQYAASGDQVAPKALALAAAQEFGLPFMDLSAFNPEHFPKDLGSEKLIRHHMVLPLYRRGSKLFLAIANPSHLTAVDEIQFQTGLSTEAILVPHDQLSKAVNTYLEGGEVAFAQLEKETIENLDTSAEQSSLSNEAYSSSFDDAPIVKFVDKVLQNAIRMGSSDIHLEPYEHSFRIRYRTDGILHEVLSPPFSLRHRITSRIKVMAQLDISERRIPQDGSIKLKASKTLTIDFRVNTLPTLWGEKIVLRVLDSGATRMSIDELGLSEIQKKIYKNALAKPQGMILVTGPTGSGKTVTLYTGLNILNTPERNISTVEDPVEINMDGINQVNVNTKIGLDFAATLRAFLRQDPDIVMIGEIRDLETAEIAIKAAQTGHLVLSTLHTNSASETLTRLNNMGIPSFNIATSVSLIIAQRLARKLCSNCKAFTEIPEKTLVEAGFSRSEVTSLKLYEPIGCEKCNNGYKGRVGIYELLPVTYDISQMILNNANAIEIAQQAAKEGFPGLKASALDKVRSGVTTLAEIHRVIQH